MSGKVKEERLGSSGRRFSLSLKFSRVSLYWLNRALPILGGLVVLVYLYFHAPSFYRINNLLNILVQTSSLGLLAIGMTFVLVTGGIDLSMPANMAFGAVLGGLVMRASIDQAVWWGTLVMLAVPAAIGFLNGYAVAYLRMVPFVVTLATMTVVGGTTVWLTNSRSVTGFPKLFFEGISMKKMIAAYKAIDEANKEKLPPVYSHESAVRWLKDADKTLQEYLKFVEHMLDSNKEVVDNVSGR